MKRYDEEFAVLLEGINGMQAGMAASLLEDAEVSVPLATPALTPRGPIAMLPASTGPLRRPRNQFINLYQTLSEKPNAQARAMV